MEYEQSEIPTLGQTDIAAAAERERKHTGEKRLQRQSYNANINEIHDLCCICESMHSVITHECKIVSSLSSDFFLLKLRMDTKLIKSNDLRTL